MNDRITLTMQDILEKEFKIDARGYRPQEVDKFLDIIIKDYNEYNNIIRNLEKEKRALALENQNLKNEARNLRSSIEAARIGEKEITNVDLLRRISQLEKIILGKSEQSFLMRFIIISALTRPISLISWSAREIVGLQIWDIS